MEPCVTALNWPAIVGAIGSVLCSLLTIYLVHRRILADSKTMAYRQSETEAHEAALVALGVAEAAAKLRGEAKT